MGHLCDSGPTVDFGNSCVKQACAALWLPGATDGGFGRFLLASPRLGMPNHNNQAAPGCRAGIQECLSSVITACRNSSGVIGGLTHDFLTSWFNSAASKGQWWMHVRAIWAVVVVFAVIIIVLVAVVVSAVAVIVVVTYIVVAIVVVIVFVVEEGIDVKYTRL